MLPHFLVSSRCCFSPVTTPPKQRIADLSKDFYSAGFAPGANVYFSYDVPGLLFGIIISSQNHSSG